MKNLRNAAIIVIAALALQACNKKSHQPKKIAERSEQMVTRIDTASYMMGLSLGYSLTRSYAHHVNLALMLKGIKQVTHSDPKAIPEPMVDLYLDKYFAKLKTDLMKKNKKEGEAFLKANKNKPGVIQTASGLQYKILKKGTGKRPKPTDIVQLNYIGKMIDGTVFANSYKQGQPNVFSLEQVIPGWKEGIQLMRVGSKYEFYIPGDLAYGTGGMVGTKVGPSCTLIYDIELLQIKPPKKGSGKQTNNNISSKPMLHH